MSVQRLVLAGLGTALVAQAVAQSATTDAPSESIRIAIGTKEFSTATAALKANAERGDRDGEYLLGLAHLAGLGVAEDRAAGRIWLEKAAARDHAAACFALAGLLANPAATGDRADEAGAQRWLQRAVALGYSKAIEAQKAGHLPMAASWPGTNSSTTLRFAFARWSIESAREDLLDRVGARSLVDQTDDFGRSLLGWAAFVGNARASRQLLEYGARVDAADAFGITPVMLAVAHDSTETTAVLLAAGASVALTDRAQRSALAHAAWADRPKQIALLVGAKADMNGVDARGWTALDVAIQRDRAAAAAELKQLGASARFGAGDRATLATGIDASRTGKLYQGWTPLMLAVSRADEPLARQLLQAGADAKAVTPQADSLLHVAIEAKAAALIPILVAAGASADLENASRESAIELAVRRGDEAIVSTLLNSLKSNEAERRSQAALAATRAGQASVLRAILRMGANPELPLITAVRSGSLEGLRAWREHGADLNASDRDGRSPLWYAARDGKLPIVKELLDAKAKVNAADRDGVTPLYAAVVAGHAPVVNTLIAAGAQVEARSRQGVSTLAAAAAAGHEEIVQRLLTQKPDLDGTDAFGNTALLLAARAGHVAVCRVLLEAGASSRIRNSDRISARDMAEMRGDAALTAVFRDR